MSSGVERAIQELHRLQQADPKSFTIVGEPLSAEGRLVAKVSLRLGPIESVDGGLELREREEFVLHVSSGFPFDRPQLTVEHDRFAAFPHVIWTYGICLYRNAADWNPRDGLYGFFEKLRMWLWKAAINDMDPADVPLEPPHHVTAFSQVPFVVRANAPAQAGQAWIGYAMLERHPNRIELVGWTELVEGWPAGQEAALAIMLPKPLPMEFPRKGKDVFLELAKQQIDRDSVIRFLACAATLSAPDELIHLVLGLPMRRAADGSQRQHVAVWTTSPAFAKGLRLTLAEEEDSATLKEMRRELADVIYALLEDDDIAWCQILEDRQEIVVPRDQGSPVSWFRGKRILLLGCGGLGSWVGEVMARAGAARIDLVDKEKVKPGLLARQNFGLEDIGANKALALAGRLQSIAAGTQCDHFAKEAHAFVMQDPDRFRTYDAVIDCTASAIMQMKLESDWLKLARRTPPMISIGIDATARRCIAVAVPANAVGGVWDAYVQLRHRLCMANTNREVIDAFYSERAGLDLVQPEPGCSEPTFRGSTADVSGLTAFALNLAVPHLREAIAPCGIAFTSPAATTSHVVTDVIELANFEEMRAGQYRIRLAKNVHREARAWVQQYNRTRSAAHETGGLLWGLWDDAVEVIWVFDASGPPADSKHDPGHFACGVEGTAEEHRRRMALTRGGCGFVGMWHTHPQMLSQQSMTDVAGMAGLVGAIGQNQRRALMMIYGRMAAQPTAGFYVYESQSMTKLGELITVGTTQVSLETAVV